VELTKREFIAFGILKAMLSSPHTFSEQKTVSDYIQSSFSAADEFIKTGSSTQDTMESVPTDTQHLQAEIAALTIRLETYVRNACLEDKEVFDIAAKMRQLSAMQ